MDGHGYVAGYWQVYEKTTTPGSQLRITLHSDLRTTSRSTRASFRSPAPPTSGPSGRAIAWFSWCEEVGFETPTQPWKWLALSNLSGTRSVALRILIWVEWYDTHRQRQQYIYTQLASETL